MSAPHILIVDDEPHNLKLLHDRLEYEGYQVATAENGHAALAAVALQIPDLVLLDVMMPDMDGYEVCRRLRDDEKTAQIRIVLVTALGDTAEKVRGLKAGADDFLTKPVSAPELLVRVKNLLRNKELMDEVQQQAGALERLNQELERRVEKQVEKIRRLELLRRFLPRHVAELMADEQSDNRLQSHRREIAVIFCDLRSFSAFAETAEPEETMLLLAEYHEILDHLVDSYNGTIDHRAGDGMMVFLNDPVSIPQPAQVGAELAVRMRSAVLQLLDKWRRRGYELGFGIGMSFGFATMGLIGKENRVDYIATGRAVNIASRLCDVAKDQQILVPQRVFAEIENVVSGELVGEQAFQGFARPLMVYNILDVNTVKN